jgi:prephenate dehydrogenase
MFDKVAIIGPGLIGGSMGMALRRRKLAGHVVGIGRRRVSLDAATKVGAIDSSTLDMSQGLSGADLVVLATPIGTFDRLAGPVAAALSPGAVLTEVASSKVQVIRTLQEALEPRSDVQLVPTHPMAGSEQSGPLAADEALFEGSVCIVTPLPEEIGDAHRRVRELWQALGATVVDMTPSEHDRLVARISHVPHLAASALMHTVDEETMHYCGGGLRDTTRIAASSPDLWMDIYRSNRQEIRAAMREYIDTLQEMIRALNEDDMDALRRQLGAAKSYRDELAVRLAEREAAAD